MRRRKIEQIRAIARENRDNPLTPEEKQWLKENATDAFKGEKGKPVVLCRFFDPDYKEKLAMCEKIGQKIPLHVINFQYDGEL